MTGCVQQHQEMEKVVETLNILGASFLTPVLSQQQETVTSESNRKTRKTLFVVFNSYQSDRKSVKLFFFFLFTRGVQHW